MGCIPKYAIPHRSAGNGSTTRAAGGTPGLQVSLFGCWHQAD